MQPNPQFITEILEIDTTDFFDKAVTQTVKILNHGQLAAIPTETVYGLAASGFNPEAVSKIYEVKGRPAHNPLILHVASIAMISRCADSIPEALYALSEEFWPGPLTLVLKKSGSVPDIVTAGGPTVAVRWPGHPFFRAVIERHGFPIAAPSANLSNRLSPTTAEHVKSQLFGMIPLIIDGGHCAVGIESTVIDLSSSPPVLLRPGIISPDELLPFLPDLKVPDHIEPGSGTAHSGSQSKILKSPGQLDLHYAPNAPLSILPFDSESHLLHYISARGLMPHQVHLLSHQNIDLLQPWGSFSLIPDDPEAYARALYLQLHIADNSSPKPHLILVNLPPNSPKWLGILDRLTRASHP